MSTRAQTAPTAFIAGLGVLGPGFADWPHAVRILSRDEPWVDQKTVLVAPDMLPAAERRRSVRVVRLALTVGLEAVAAANADAGTLATVFASSGGDGYNCHALCETLASDDRQISPTRFHNSVHNAAAGYWSIATGAKAASAVLCAFDGSFAAGLLEAIVQVSVDRRPSLLVAYDADYPEPLRAARPLPDAFGVAVLLTPGRGPACAGGISVEIVDAAPNILSDPTLDALRLAIPAARSLPLLTTIALGEPARVVLEYLDRASLAVDYTP